MQATSVPSPVSRGRLILFPAAGLALGEVFFGLFSGILDHFGDTVEIVGHLIGLPILAIIFMAVTWRALPWRRRGLAPAAAVAAILSTAAYVGGFLLLGPPLDTVLNIVAIGLVLATAQLLLNRVAGPLPAVMIGIGFCVGAAAATAVVVPFAAPLNRALHGGPIPFAITLGAIGAIAGLIGGAALAWALSRTREPASEPATEPLPTY